jgi:hypothetical protein
MMTRAQRITMKRHRRKSPIYWWHATIFKGELHMQRGAVIPPRNRGPFGTRGLTPGMILTHARPWLTEGFTFAPAGEDEGMNRKLLNFKSVAIESAIAVPPEWCKSMTGVGIEPTT